MKNKTRKILDFLTQDIHLKHNYYLIGGILIILALVGYTSYSLFSYEHSESIYVSFKDTEKPVCVIGAPADKSIYTSSTTTFTMNCTDNYRLADVTLTSSNFTISGDITITSIEKEGTGKEANFTITVTAGTFGGDGYIKLNSNSVKDNSNNYNETSSISDMIKIYKREIPNVPILASNMIPVYYDGTQWVKADKNNINENHKWYDYNEKKWANAITVTVNEDNTRDDLLNASIGTPIPMDRINTMWVWIPRFSAVATGEYNGATSFICSKSGVTNMNTCWANDATWRVINPGAFDVTFVDINTSAHDAFAFGTQNLSGLWIGKFEISHSTLSSSTTIDNLSCTDDTCENAKGIEILPNKVSLRYNNVSNFFYASRSMEQSENPYGFDKTKDITLDTHMIKNSEWGVVAYLTQSIYGRCTSRTRCNEVGNNNNSNLVTGYGAPAGSGATVKGGFYETALGMDASTTGNIYGVYDMNGGATEYVMGVYWNGSKLWSGSSGFNGCIGYSCSPKEDGVSYPADNKYYNLYKNTDRYSTKKPVTDYINSMQHALLDTRGWYSDLDNFITVGTNWFIRGGYVYNDDTSGIFTYNNSTGSSSSYNGTRFIITID